MSPWPALPQREDSGEGFFCLKREVQVLPPGPRGPPTKEGSSERAVRRNLKQTRFPLTRDWRCKPARRDVTGAKRSGRGPSTRRTGGATRCCRGGQQEGSLRLDGREVTLKCHRLACRWSGAARHSRPARYDRPRDRHSRSRFFPGLRHPRPDSELSLVVGRDRHPTPHRPRGG